MKLKLVPSLKLSQKLPLALIGSAIVVAAGVGIGSYVLASGALEAQARQHLETIAFERANQLSTFIKSIESDLTKTAASDDARYALNGFAKAWKGLNNPSLNMQAAPALQAAFVTGDPAKRIDVDKVDGQVASYSANNAHYQPIYRQQIKAQGYHDLYLFDLDGNLVYSALKGDDFATSFAQGGGKFADSALATAYRAATATTAPSRSRPRRVRGRTTPRR